MTLVTFFENGSDSDNPEDWDDFYNSENWDAVPQAGEVVTLPTGYNQPRSDVPGIERETARYRVRRVEWSSYSSRQIGAADVFVVKEKRRC